MGPPATSSPAASAPSPAPVGSSTAVAPAATCAARVVLLERRVSEAVSRPPQTGSELDVPRVDRAQPWIDAPRVSLVDTAYVVNGQRGPDWLSALERKRALWKIFHPAETKDTWDVVVAVDGRAPAARLSTVVGQLERAGWSPQLLVRLPDLEPIETDPPHWLVDVLGQVKGAASAEARLRLIADASDRATGGCTSLRERMTVVDQERDPTKKPAAIRDALVDGLLGCECDADVAALEALAVFVIAGDTARYGVLALDGISSTGTIAESRVVTQATDLRDKTRALD